MVGRRIGDTGRVPGRGVRRTLAVLVALAVAAGIGAAVALTAPSFASTLGIADPGPAPVVPAVPRPMLGPLDPAVAAATAGGVAGVLDDAADDVPGQLTGVVVDPVSEDVLWSRTPEQALVPGSTTKVLVGAAALLTLDPHDAFVTRVVSGPQPGSVVLIGGGDPTLSALPPGRQSVYPGAPTIAELAEEVRASAGAPIDTVIVDTSRYQGDRLAQGWAPEDIGMGYIAPIQSLMLDGGRTAPTVQDGARTTEPALAAGRALAAALGADTVTDGRAPDGARRLGAVASVPVSELVELMLRTSDNVLGETLAREVAVARDGVPTFAGGAEQVLAALNQAGFDVSDTTLNDGSGLSKLNRIPARLLGAVMAAAAAPAEGDTDTVFLRPVVSGLPVAGGDGTLDDRYGADSDAAAGRGVVRAKTGTLTGVSSLAGVVADDDGRLLVFAFMANGASPAQLRPALDEMAARLSECGCR